MKKPANQNLPVELAHKALLSSPEGRLPAAQLARAAFKLKGKVPGGLAAGLLRQILSGDGRFVEAHEGFWRLAALPDAVPLENAVFTVVDLETTGGQPNYNRVIQIGAFRVAGGRVGESYMTFVNPRRKIPLQISYLTGIYDEHVAAAPVFEEVAERLVGFIGDSVFVAHNARFDSAFINAELQRMGARPLENQVLCTVRLARRLVPDAASRELGALAAHLGIDLTDERHTAHGDAWATAHVLLHCLKMLPGQGVHTLEGLMRFQSSRTRRPGKKA